MARALRSRPRPASQTNYEFFIGASSVQSGASNTFTTSTLANADAVSVVVTSAASCTGTSNVINMVVNPNPVPVLSSSDVDNTICSGNSVTFTATPAGQSNYEFFVDGVSAQSSNVDNFVTTSLLNGQTVTVRITNASSCSVLSSGITTTVNPNPIATLISSDGDNIICAGTSVTFTAAPAAQTNYEFFIGASSVQSGASNTFTTSTLANADAVSVVVTSAASCTGTSNVINMVVNPNPVPVLSSSDVDNIICAGNSVTFTATPAGQSNYEFFVDGVSAQSSNVDNFVTTSLLNGQSVTVRITNASSCSVLSSGITTTVNPNPVATLISSDGDNIICNGTSVTFTAAPASQTNYEFFIGASSVQSGASNTFTTSTLANADAVSVVVTSAASCTGTSNVINMVVNPNPVPVLSSSDVDNTICSGNSVTFTATPAGQSNYEFFVDGVSAQSSNVDNFVTTSLLNGQTVTVRITKREQLQRSEQRDHDHG